jgi:tetrapyrrole methylase family protein / MazG family protein
VPVPKAKIEDLVKLMARLRSDQGCPWDKEQTPESLETYIIEEAYELVDAIETGFPQKICDELGDLLFQVVFQAQIFSERKQFDLSDVFDRIHKKMVERHPHVFGGKQAKTPDDVKKQWVQIKKETRPENSVLGDAPQSLPALMRARRLTDAAAQVGFDWENTRQVEAKVNEELAELKKAVKSRRKQEIEHEFGDVLFALVNLGRFLKVNPENALKKATGRFEKRFHHIESSAKKQNRRLNDMSLKEMDELWEEAKKLQSPLKNRG